MALLKLNGVNVQVTDSDWEPVRLGEMVRSLNGSPRSTARVRKANYRFTSSLLTVPQAQLLRALVEGEGHVLNFDDNSTASAHLYTSTCMAPVSGPPLGSGYQRVSGKFLNGVRIYEPHVIEYRDLAPLFSPLTMLGWTNYFIGGWRHVIVAWDGAGTLAGWWLDGIAQTELFPPFYTYEPDTGTVALSGSDGDVSFDDVVILPYMTPPEWAPHLYAFHNARPWPALPFVLAEDPRLPAGGLLCRGEAGAGKAMRLRSSVGEVFDFTLYGT